MRCHEVRQFLGPYLDSELDAKTTQEIESHLESCTDCARVFASEETLDTRIFAALRQGPRTPAIWEKLEARITPARRFARFTRSHPLVSALVAVAAAACVAVLAVLNWPGTPPLELAAAAEKHHRAYVDQVMAPEFTGSVPAQVAQRLGDRLDAAAFSCLPSKAAFTSTGARLCNLSGTPVAWIFGRYDGQPVSVLVFKKSELARFPATKRQMEVTDGVLCTRAGRYQFAARVVGDHVVCAIGNTSMAELDELVKSVNNAT